LQGRRPAAGLIHHTDRGSPYASDDYRTHLARSGLIASMSATGDCYDNAVAESFFASLKTEWVDRQDYETHTAAVTSLADYIDGFYNTARRHSHLDYVSPIQFEMRSHLAALRHSQTVHGIGGRSRLRRRSELGSGIHDVIERLQPLLGDADTQKSLAILRRSFLDRVAVFLAGGRDDDLQADVVGFVSQLLDEVDKK
jgi:hypothetical protein